MSSHSDAKTIVALVPHNPSYNHTKIKERGRNRGHRLALQNGRQAPACSSGTARRHRLAVKQAKMATARRYTTGQQCIMVNEHKTAKKKNYSGSLEH